VIITYRYRDGGNKAVNVGDIHTTQVERVEKVKDARGVELVVVVQSFGILGDVEMVTHVEYTREQVVALIDKLSEALL